MLFYPFFGEVPLLKQTTEKKGALILTSLEDLGFGAPNFAREPVGWQWLSPGDLLRSAATWRKSWDASRVGFCSQPFYGMSS